MRLHDLATQAAATRPDAVAIEGPDGTLTYAQLDALANRIARTLTRVGVGKGDCVCLWLDKSTTAIAAMQAALRIGAAYVPIDPLSPASRAESILAGCAAPVVMSSRPRLDSLSPDALRNVSTLCVDGSGTVEWAEVLSESPDAMPDADVSSGDLAYILYTSGSTGTPKGVQISHRNALAFIDWAADEIDAVPDDRLSNHAPFHFDLSVLDIYVAFHAAATVVLIPDGFTFAPRKLVQFIQDRNISIWYSVPSVLILMLQHGRFPEVEESPLRAILFAGETFPIEHLRTIHERWPNVRLLNLYGPTETNVCTFFEVHELDPDRRQPVPIGRGCSGNRVWAERADGSIADVGEEGELMVDGPTVMLGYRGDPPRQPGPYPTGDIVRRIDEVNYDFIGRRDHMVKLRGHRIELGEIESALNSHPAVSESAAVVAGTGMNARLVAFLVLAGESRPNLLEVKEYCAARLPRYMIVESVRVVSSLPRTRNGKTDRPALIKLLDEKQNVS